MDNAPDPQDVAFGKALQDRRKALGLSQQTVADAIGVSLTQISKYERGANRIALSRMIPLFAVLQTNFNQIADAAGLCQAEESVL